MAVSGKAKGSEFERRVAKQLSGWISNGLRDDLLWRSALSGGRATLLFKQGKKNKSQTGDLSSIDALSQEFIDKFFCEIKFYKSLDITSGFVKGTGLLKGFWDKLAKDALAAKKNPLLIAKQNHLPTLLIVHPKGAGRLNLDDRILLCSDAQVAVFSQWPAVVYLFDKLIETQPFKISGVIRERFQ